MSILYIDSKNFNHNIDVISSRVGGVEKIAIVLKDNGYGHGILEIAKLAKLKKITKAVVRNLKEAILIKPFFEEIIVLGEIPKEYMGDKIHITINSLEDIEKIPQNSYVELKVDVGMHRLGIMLDEVEVALKLILEQKLTLKGVFSHFSHADKLGSEHFCQREIFEGVKQRVLKFCKPQFHISNSSAIFRENSFIDDFARVGIGAFGYVEGVSNLLPVASLYANKVASRTILKGQKVSYGGDFIAPKDMVVSTYDIGYGDGFFRVENYTLPNGKKILGKVSMDYIVIDTDSDLVCIFNDVKELARLAKTITYDVLVKLSSTINRVIV